MNRVAATPRAWAASEPIARAPAPVPHLRNVSRFLIAFAFLQVLDMTTTLVLIAIGGVELNPVAAWSLRHGVPAFIVLKILLAVVLVGFVPLMEREPGKARAATWTCLGLDVLFGAVVVSNAVQFILFV